MYYQLYYIRIKLGGILGNRTLPELLAKQSITPAISYPLKLGAPTRNRTENTCLQGKCYKPFNYKGKYRRRRVCRWKLALKGILLIPVKLVSVEGFKPPFHGPKPRVIIRLYDTEIGCLGRDRTYDILINSQAQLPTVLLGNKTFGAHRETRTLKTWFLRPVCIPIPSHGQNFGGRLRIRTPHHAVPSV